MIFGKAITATGTDATRLPDAVAEQISGTARVLLRRAYGSRDTAYAGCLPQVLSARSACSVISLNARLSQPPSLGVAVLTAPFAATPPAVFKRL
jgi:hypothetical protein